MKTRTILCAVIIASAALTTLNVTVIRSRIAELKSDLAIESRSRIAAQSDLASTRHDLVATTRNLAETRTTLETALTEANAETTRANLLEEHLIASNQNLDKLQAELSVQKTERVEADQEIKVLHERLATAQEQNKLLTEARQTRLPTSHRSGPVVLPATLHAKVLVFDPKWNFVVLNAGEDQGALPEGELLLSRNGKLTAKVIVRRIEKNRSVANVVSGWELAEIREGDAAIPAFPGS